MRFPAQSAALSVLTLLSSFRSTEAQEPYSKCSCSPQIYSFTMSFFQTCSNDSIENSAGIFTTVCSIDSNLEAGEDWEDLIPDVGESLVKRRLQEHSKDSKHEMARRIATSDMVPVKVISIVFAEVNSDGSLLIINKNDTLSDVELENGAVVQFESVSSTLDSNVGIDDQLSKVPGGVTLLVVGKNANGELVKTRMLWLYNNDCDVVPLTETAVLGWVTVDTLKKAFGEFCLAIDDSSKTTSIVEAKAGKSSHSGNILSKSGKNGKSIAVETIMSATGTEGDLASIVSITKTGKTTNNILLSKSGKTGSPNRVKMPVNTAHALFPKAGKTI